MTTFVAYHYADIKRFIEEYIRPKMENKHVSLIAPDPIGNWIAPSKRRKYYQVCFAIAPEIFSISALGQLMSTFGFAFFVVPAKLVKPDPVMQKMASMEEFIK